MKITYLPVWPWAFLALLFELIPIIASHSSQSKLILISFDGFRHDYISKAKAAGKLIPNFDKFKKEGTSAKYIRGSYISKTFPNHFTIATGRTEENHGIVGNNFYDPVFNETFDIGHSDNDPKWWNNGSIGVPAEPIWITNQRGPQTHFQRHSGVFYWPGSETSYNGMFPFKYKQYSKTDRDFTGRVKTVVSWFATEDEPINLGLMYFNEPDHTGHQFGPDSSEILDKIVELDEVLGTLLDELKLFKLHDVNIILTSDHGMASTNQSIDLGKYVNKSDLQVYGTSPVFHIKPNEESKLDQIYKALKLVPHVKVFRREEIPVHYHYKNNRRIMPLVIEAELGYDLAFGNSKSGGGNHGYDNREMSMHPFFLSMGPAFRKNYTIEPFELVDVYQLMCKILDINPAPNDGNLKIAGTMLLSEHEEHKEEGVLNLTIVTFLGVIGFAALVSSIICIKACHAYPVRRYGIRPTPLSDVLDVEKNHLLVSDDDDEI